MSELIEKLKRVDEESKLLLADLKTFHSSLVKCGGEIENMTSISELIKKSFGLYKDIVESLKKQGINKDLNEAD